MFLPTMRISTRFPDTSHHLLTLLDPPAGGDIQQLQHARVLGEDLGRELVPAVAQAQDELGVR
jgi:hypothetical protein